MLLSLYHMVCNFREGFIFVFFASQEPFAKIKTTKFLLSTCKASEPRFNLAYFKLSSRLNSNRSLLVSVPLTAIAQAIQESEVLRKHRRTKRTAAQGQVRKQLFLWTSWVRGYFSRHTGTKSYDCHLSL